jgi:hypothetical protein
MRVFYYCTNVGSESMSKLIERLIIEKKNEIINMQQDLFEIPLLNLIVHLCLNVVNFSVYFVDRPEI